MTGGTADEPKKKKTGFWSRVFGAATRTIRRTRRKDKDKKPDGGR